VADVMKIGILTVTGFAMVYAKDYLVQQGIYRGEYYTLALFSVLGMMIMSSAYNFITIYLGLELLALSMYALVAFNRDSMGGAEAAMKYFVLGALASGLLLYGISLIYGFTGATNYVDIAEALSSSVSSGAVIGIIFVIAGTAFKISAAPFHMWTPDVYEGSPTIVTAFFAIVPKVAAMALFLRVTYGMLGPVPETWRQVVAIIAVLSMVVGALSAIMQTDLKRLMAYSSIAHMGYALVGMSAANDGAVSAVMLYMLIYVISSIGVFALILNLTREGEAVHRINDLKGYSRSHPLHAACLLVFMFSMAGIPPLGGFFGKWYVFSAAIASGQIILAVVGVLASVIGAFYYIRIVKVMYVDDETQPIDQNIPRSNTLIALTSAGIMMGFVFVLSLLRETVQATVPFVVFVAG
ncbi:MAG: NADH-quinone oxidoreductase subunit N, partial [Alphaproteobacteria bacterium]|nr:NADH-quinone oxidoreductase subunit N [Alphaproteobacteria bacterium]